MLILQKYLNFFYLLCREHYELKKFRELSATSQFSKQRNEALQLQKLNALLNHAYKHVPYYKNVFKESDLLIDGVFELTSLNQITALPFLRKSIIRDQQYNLHSDDHNSRNSFINRSGGSTGEPLYFLQDKLYNINNIANFHLVKSWRGATPYDSEITIWGAPRDTFGDTKPISEKLKDFCRNRIVLNSFKMSSQDMHHYIELINNHKPQIIVTYAQSIYELAIFAKEHNIPIKKQHAIHTAASTLYPYMREAIKSVFKCEVFDHYGCRETGAIASECSEHNGLHIMMDHTLVEVINSSGQPAKTGEQGEIVITTLDNFSMPLIRYKMSDIAIMQEYKLCSCGCTYPKLQEVVGRTTDMFKTMSGDVITPIFFKFLLGVRCNHGYIESYQVIQEALDLIIIKIVKHGDIPKEDLELLEEKIKVVMGDTCKIRFEFVEHIAKTETGKFLYTISKLSNKEER
ncbi:MAG: AMP-binding protein [Campylobacterota bacterium]|nr:AMP-binding protein [Campylobacterota bacterium]